MSEQRIFIIISYVFVLLLFTGTDGHAARDVNVTNILLQYTLVCGYDFICNKTYIKDYPRPESSYYQTNICPKCHCDSCMGYGDCCPDKFLENPFRLTCRSVSVLQGDQSKRFWMLEHCPDGSSEVEKNACSRIDTGANLLNSLPVTSYKSGITYRNEHCAKCNGEFKYSKWSFDFKCKKFSDFNFLSSYQEVWDMAKQKVCKISYKEPYDIYVDSVCNINEDRIVYRKCNMTGLWRSYDPDIEWACKNYGVPYKQFQNIFCYICNPLRSSVPYIDTCNNFRVKKNSDKGFIEACSKLPSTSATYPFKNIFCFFCNVGHVDESTKLDIKVNDMTEEYHDSKYMYYFDLNEFNGEYFSSTLPKNPSSMFDITNLVFLNFAKIYELFEHDIVYRDNTLINVTELQLHYLSYTGKLPLANIHPKYFPFTSALSPYCDKYEGGIFENNKEMCIDVVLRYPFTCLSNQYLSTAKKSYTKESLYYVTDQCWRPGVSQELKSRCESPNINDSLSMIPVTSGSRIEYRNWYCFICNEHNLNTWNVWYLAKITRGYKLWNLQMTCQSFLDYAHYPTLYDVINAARDQRCSISMVPKHSYGDRFCNRGTTFTNKCYNPSNVSRSVEWACEQFNHPALPPIEDYKNIFCKSCNSDLSEATIDLCNVTGRWSSYDQMTEYGCLSLPAVPEYVPYKNIFCGLCNGMSWPLPSSTTTPFATDPTFLSTSSVSQTTTVPNIGDVSFRSIFALESYDEDDDDQEIVNDQKCQLKHQIYDPWEDNCRNKSCFPGKLLVNGTCVPLLRYTSNLGYILALRLDVYIEGFLECTMEDFLSRVKVVLTDELQFGMETNISVLSFYALSQSECKTSLLNVTEFSIKIYIKFYTCNNVERLKTELYLQELTNKSLYFNIRNSDVYIDSFRDLDSLFLPLTLQFTVPNQCAMIETIAHSSVTTSFYQAVYVSKLLTCIQLELGPDEFRMDPKTLKLMLTFAKNFPLSFDEFHLLPNGKAKVCSEDFPQKDSIFREKPNTKILSYLTLISTILSLCCLFVTFLTYCLFPQLRTIPGKNNMSLVFSIFVSRVLLQFGLHQTSVPLLCIILSLLTHLFWLSMFGCMFVCSFHMFYVFRGIQLPMERHQGNKVIFRYISLSYGLPTLIVTSHICVYLGLTQGVDTGYGDGKCFINDKLSCVLSFLLPISLVCILNVVFFAITLIKIKTTPKVQSNAQDRNELSIYLKLFTLTGITWLLQVVDSFLSVSALSHIVVILNGFQGLFIFVSYTCNRRILKLYRDRFFKSDYSVSSNTYSSSVTRNTLVSTMSASDSPKVKQNIPDSINLKMINAQGHDR